MEAVSSTGFTFIMSNSLIVAKAHDRKGLSGIASDPTVGDGTLARIGPFSTVTIASCSCD